MGITKEKSFKLNPNTTITTTIVEEFLEPEEYVEFDYKQAASDLIDSLDEQFCILFVNELKNKCEEIIVDNNIIQKNIDEKYRILTEFRNNHLR
jgi:hypothetical protein